MLSFLRSLAEGLEMIRSAGQLKKSAKEHKTLEDKNTDAIARGVLKTGGKMEILPKPEGSR